MIHRRRRRTYVNNTFMWFGLIVLGILLVIASDGDNAPRR